MNGAPLPADAGLPEFLLWLLQQVAGMNWISAHTLAGLVSLVASAVTVASFIAPHLAPPAADAPIAGRARRALYWLRVAVYRVVILLAQARGNVAPIAQPGRVAVMVPAERHEELATMVARAVPGSPDQAKP